MPLNFETKDYRRLFTSHPLSVFLDRKTHELNNEIDALNNDELIRVAIEDYIIYFSTKYHVTAPSLNTAAPTIEAVEGKFLSNKPGEEFVVGFLYCVTYPFVGDSELFNFYSDNQSPVKMRGAVTNDHLIIAHSSDKFDSMDVDAPLEAKLRDIENELNRQRGKIDSFNKNIKEVVKIRIEQRKARLSAMGQVLNRLGYPLTRRKEDDAGTIVVPIARKLLRPVPAISKASVPEYRLNEVDYRAVLQMLASMSLAMERSPTTFAHLTEEQIRDFFLVTLNANFDGAATGETFNRTGRTDILIRSGNSNIFVCECKFWDGSAKHSDTIDQLLSYVTWRDTRTAILIFNRRANFTAVLAKIAETTKSHSSFIEEKATDTETEFRYIFRHPRDEELLFDVTVLAFDVPVSDETSGDVAGRSDTSR
jgi:hypothetical protein